MLTVFNILTILVHNSICAAVLLCNIYVLSHQFGLGLQCPCNFKNYITSFLLRQFIVKILYDASCSFTVPNNLFLICVTIYSMSVLILLHSQFKEH